MRKSLYSCHVDRWKDGCGADICSRATRRVFARGDIPADILFCGEAPGDSEDCLGQPFVGPAGQLLDKMIQHALEGKVLCIAFYNLLGCIPLEDNGHKMKEPPDDAVKQCKPRLEEFLTIAQPRLIVQVGKCAEAWLEQGNRDSVQLPNRNTPMVAIHHPAYILRANYAQQSMLRKKVVVTIAEAIQKYLGGKQDAANR